MNIIKNKVKISNLNKFNKMSLFDFESKKEKYKKELGNNYEYLHAIKSGNFNKYSEVSDLEKLKEWAEYFFGNIPVIHQKALIKGYKQISLRQSSAKTLLLLQQEDFLNAQFPLGYIHYLNSRIYVENNL